MTISTEASIAGAARDALTAIDNLIAESHGVAGLHLNGDMAPWDELLAGGRFEDWLLPLEALRSALAAPTAPSAEAAAP
ncbi:MAG: hypothetical protein E7K72_19325 [Roseomonas mucosa]|nr:hypothetical protein [Roseomonas mucosa]